MSSLRNFINNLDENVMELGLDPRFKENPAYKKVLFQIEALVLEMNMMEDLDRVFVRKENEAFKFEWFNPTTKQQYEFEVFVPSTKTELCCCEIIDSTNKDGGKEYQEKFVVDVSSKIDSFGRIAITSKYGKADNLNCSYGNCNTSCGVERKEYDKFGVQEVDEIESFGNGKVNDSIEKIHPATILANTRFAFMGSLYCKQRTIARREYLDVVNIAYEDKNTGEKFIGKQILNQEHGLQDLQYSTFNFGEHVVIEPLMNAEIEEMLEKEDPKVAEGLRRYVKGRDGLSYDSENSKDSLYRARQI